MNNDTYPKIIVGGCMAAALAIGITVFALTHHAAPTLVQQPAPPPPTTEQSPPAAVSQVTQSSEGTTQAAPPDSGASKVEATPPSVAKASPATSQPRNRAVAPSAVAADVGVKRAIAPDRSSESAAAAVVPSANGEINNIANDAPTSGDAPQGTSKPNGGSDYATNDQQITSDVKSEISRDGSNQGSVIDVTTDHGVVVLSGSVPDQNTFDHVREVVARVKGVMSVDTSGLSVTSLMSAAIAQ